MTHGTVPLDASWSSVPVSVDVLMILMIHWVLGCLPLAVRVRHGWVLWQHSADNPLCKIWVVKECLRMHLVVVHHNGTVVQQTTSKTSDNKVHAVEVCNPATGIKVLYWKLTDYKESKCNSNLGSGCVVSEVPVRFISWSADSVETFAPWEPRSQLINKS